MISQAHKDAILEAVSKVGAARKAERDAREALQAVVRAAVRKVFDEDKARGRRGGTNRAGLLADRLKAIDEALEASESSVVVERLLEGL